MLHVTAKWNQNSSDDCRYNVLRKADVKYALLQTGAAQRYVYVFPIRECIDKQFMRRLDTAEYGSVNSIDK